MKKKIFIAGEVRDYDSADPKKLADEIKKHICDNIVPPECADAVNIFIDEPADKMIRIRYPFTPGNECGIGTISKEMYRCFTGEYSGFEAEYSCWWKFGFGTAYPMNIRFDVDDVIDCHKKNTRFYKANRYKKLTLTESDAGLEAIFQF